MKFIWLSVHPLAPSGYGTVTRQIVPRLVNEGHEVIIATKHFHTGYHIWNGVPVIQGLNVNILNRMVDKGEADYIISLLDNHALTDVPKKWVSYTPFDTEKLPESIRKWLVHPELIIGLTRHGQAEIEKAGFECMYAPHGVDTQVYCPNETLRLEERKVLGWENNFIIGAVGVNYPDDRKNFINLIHAFKKFHERHNEARLFMVSNPIDTDGGDHLVKCIQNLGLNNLMKWTDPDLYFTGQVTDEMVANRYRGMDVMCLPTRGEGFGLPLIEAQACGVPVITTGASTGPELCATQYLIPVQWHEWQWFNKDWRPNVNADSIFNALEKAYNDTNRVNVGKQGHGFAQFYDWDRVFEDYWKPILKKIEGLKVRVKTIPDYRRLYETFDGRITMGECGKWCKKECPASQRLLPGEKQTDRPILSRSYPVFPDYNGTLLVDIACPLHNWISQKFKKEVKELWEYLWGFPSVRNHFQDSKYINCIPIDKLQYDFNDEYKWAMQSHYVTNIPDISSYLKGKVLEVGCGDGKRVKELRDRGIDAIGVEINPAHVNEYVQNGDAEHLAFLDGSCDVVYSVDVLEHLSEPLQAISEAFRVSRDKVIASITPADDKCFYQDPTHCVEWTRERWLREFNEYGEIIDILEPFTIIARKRKYGLQV